MQHNCPVNLISAMTIPTEPDPRIERTRKVVLEAAAELIAECGLGRTTIEAVAERSGVARSTIYRHWPNRSDLLHESVANHMAQTHESLTGELRSDLARTFSHISEMLSDATTRSFFASFIAEGTRGGDMGSLSAKLTTTRRELTIDVINQAIERGDLVSTIDSSQFADDLAAGIVFRGMVLRQPVDSAWLLSHIDRMIEIHSRV